MKKEKIFYTDDTVFSGFKNSSRSFTVRLGYMPETKLYAAIRPEDPSFCFTGDTLEEAKDKTRRALEFYVDHGLQEPKND